MKGAKPVLGTLPVSLCTGPSLTALCQTLPINLSVASRVIRRMLEFHQRGESASPTRNGGLPEASGYPPELSLSLAGCAPSWHSPLRTM